MIEPKHPSEARGWLSARARGSVSAVAGALVVVSALASAAIAQTGQSNTAPSPGDRVPSVPSLTPNTGIEIRGPIDDIPQIRDIKPDFNTTVVPRRVPGAEDAEAGPESRIKLVAKLTRTNEKTITEGLVWRIFSVSDGSPNEPKLIQTLRDAAPNLTLPQGTYYANAAYGRANLTRRLTVLERGKLREVFVLNAGGLRAEVGVAGGAAPNKRSVRINIYSEESDQAGQRQMIVRGARPGLTLRLNAGIYLLESRIGAANAFVRSEVSVEAGKITVARILHEAATVTFRLVTTQGGEAIPGTRWAILSEGGDVVKESVGALPSHVLAPGRYIVSAGVQGRSWRRSFTVASGTNASVEIVAQ